MISGVAGGGRGYSMSSCVPGFVGKLKFQGMVRFCSIFLDSTESNCIVINPEINEAIVSEKFRPC